MGDPEPAFGLARILETLLEHRHSGRDFEVINLAVTAINSHVIVPIAKETARYPADFWCIYMGNNEVVGQFGPGTVFGKSHSNLKWIRTSIAIKRTRTGQLANRIAEWIAPAKTPQVWEGVAMFLRQQIFSEDPRLAAVYENFRANLKTITEAGIQSGAHVLLSNVAVNLRDCSPFISALPLHLSENQRNLWEKNFQNGEQLLEAGLANDALVKFKKAIELHEDHAQSYFFLGQCFWKLGNDAAAQKCFLKARDLDGLRFRTDGKLNAIIRDYASAHASQKLRFVNAEALFAYNAAGNIPGDELFWDHVHFRFPGNYLLALAFAMQIEKCIFSKESLSEKPTWMSLSDCAQALTLTRWTDYETTESMRRRLRAEPFASQSIFKMRDARLEQQLREHRVGISTNAFDKHEAIFKKALTENPDDYMLRNLFARYLLFHGKRDEATKEWDVITRQVPSHLAAHFQKGEALAGLSHRAHEAEASLRQALLIRPDTAEIHLSLGKALLTQNKHRDALEQLDAALLLRPDFTEALIEASKVWAGLDKKDEARKSLKRAKETQPKDQRLIEALKNLDEMLDEKLDKNLKRK